MKHWIYLLLPGIIMLNACCKQDKTESANPFLTRWDTPFGVPPFDKIKNEHYMPAFLEGIKQDSAEIAAIIASIAEPTFDNTILPLDKSGDLLAKVKSVFSNLNEANTNKEMEELNTEIAPMLSAHHDDIILNEALFARIKKVYEKRNESQ